MISTATVRTNNKEQTSVLAGFNIFFRNATLGPYSKLTSGVPPADAGPLPAALFHRKPGGRGEAFHRKSESPSQMDTRDAPLFKGGFVDERPFTSFVRVVLRSFPELPMGPVNYPSPSRGASRFDAVSSSTGASGGPHPERF